MLEVLKTTLGICSTFIKIIHIQKSVHTCIATLKIHTLRLKLKKFIVQLRIS